MNKESTNPTTTYSPASKVVPVYTVKGYDTSFRLAARTNDGLTMFEAVSNPKANEVSEVLDIGGKVNWIDVTYRSGDAFVYGTIDNPEKVELLVEGLMDAPLERTSIDHYYNAPPAEPNLIVFHLKDGTAAVRDYRTDTGGLSNLAGSLRDIPYDTGLDPVSGIVIPQAIRGAVNEALKAWREYQDPFNPLSEAERQRQKLTCGGTRPTAEARKTNAGGVYYTTNDVFPGCPWGEC